MAPSVAWAEQSLMRASVGRFYVVFGHPTLFGPSPHKPFVRVEQPVASVGTQNWTK